jgi:hypothetical protein
MASYLEPKLSDYEVIEAERCHYPPEIQKLLVTTKMNTVAEALEVLKRLEMLEERTANFRAEVKQDHTQHNYFQNRARNENEGGETWETAVLFINEESLSKSPQVSYIWRKFEGHGYTRLRERNKFDITRSI